MRLPRVLAIICKLCVPSNNYTDIHWDYHTAQERVRVDLYLESLLPNALAHHVRQHEPAAPRLLGSAENATRAYPVMVYAQNTVVK